MKSPGSSARRAVQPSPRDGKALLPRGPIPAVSPRRPERFRSSIDGRAQDRRCHEKTRETGWREQRPRQPTRRQGISKFSLRGASLVVVRSAGVEGDWRFAVRTARMLRQQFRNLLSLVPRVILECDEKVRSEDGQRAQWNRRVLRELSLLLEGLQRLLDWEQADFELMAPQELHHVAWCLGFCRHRLTLRYAGRDRRGDFLSQRERLGVRTVGNNDQVLCPERVPLAVWGVAHHEKSHSAS